MMHLGWHRDTYLGLLAGRGPGHHALLICGPAGIGKRQFAIELARALLCESPNEQGAACLQCPACHWVEDGNHPDLRVLVPAALAAERGQPSGGDDAQDAASEGGGGARARGGGSGRGKAPSREIVVDQIRSLDGFAEVGAHRGGRRVVIIEPADAMNRVAANALLKRLEEPPADLYFLLVTDRPEALLPTVRSRCRAVGLRRPGVDAALTWLVRETGTDAQRARVLLDVAGGSPLRARDLADERVAADLRRVIEAFAGLPDAGIVATADALQGVEPVAWAPIARSWALDLARVAAGGPPLRHRDRHERLGRLVAGTSLARLASLDRRLQRLGREAAHPLNARLLLEDVLLEFRRALAR